MFFGAGLLAYTLFVRADSFTPNSDLANNSKESHASPIHIEVSERARYDIADFTNIKSNYARSVALRRLLQSADEVQLGELYHQSERISNEYLRITTQHEILRRFAALDPSKALVQLDDVLWPDRGPLIDAIFREWMIADTESAISRLKTLGHADQRSAFAAVLSVSDVWSKTLGMELAGDLGLGTVAIDILEQFSIAMAMENPDGAWNEILEDSRADNHQVHVLATILEAWFMRDGPTVFKQVESSLAHLTFPQSVLEPVFSHWAREDPKEAFEVAQSLTEPAASDVLASVMQTWTRIDPKTAIEAASSIKSSGERFQLQQLVAHSWAQEDPRELLDNLSKFPSAVRSFVRKQALRTLSAEAPREALRRLGNTSKPHEIGDAVVKPWAEQDVYEALEWVLSQNRKDRHAYLWSIWPSLVKKDPELALKTAMDQPVDRNKVAFEPQVVRHLARIDIEQAIALLPRVRESAKVPSYAEAGHELLQRNEPDRAIQLGLQLPVSQHYDYFTYLFGQWQNVDKFGMYESMELLPTPEIKSRAALELLRGHVDKSHRLFSDDQVEHIRTYLNEQHSVLLDKDRMW